MNKAFVRNALQKHSKDTFFALKDPINKYSAYHGSDRRKTNYKAMGICFLSKNRDGVFYHIFAYKRGDIIFEIKNDGVIIVLTYKGFSRISEALSYIEKTVESMKNNTLKKRLDNFGCKGWEGFYFRQNAPRKVGSHGIKNFDEAVEQKIISPRLKKRCIAHKITLSKYELP